ncbi:MAG: hypothetical protein N3A66_02875, partial [Planctomycetota bacterium]|nr:hypothetical protein [Planctomycetota bacterium]
MKGFKHFFSAPPRWGKNLIIRGIGVQERMPACAIDRPQGTGDHLFMFFYDPMRLGSGGTPQLYPPGAMMIWTPGRPQYYASALPYKHTWI